jgi:hypothetical protein
VDRVHVSVDRPGTLGPPWTDTGADNRHGGTLTGAWPPADPVRQSTPMGAQNGERGTGSSIRASPGLERRRGGRATTMQSGETAVLGERVAQAGREGSVSRERCGELWGGCSPFIGAGGAAASRRAGDDDAEQGRPGRN